METLNHATDLTARALLDDAHRSGGRSPLAWAALADLLEEHGDPHAAAARVLANVATRCEAYQCANDLPYLAADPVGFRTAAVVLLAAGAHRVRRPGDWNAVARRAFSGPRRLWQLEADAAAAGGCGGLAAAAQWAIRAAAAGMRRTRYQIARGLW